MMEPIFVFGTGGHAKVITDIIVAQGQYQVAAYTGDQALGSADCWHQEPFLPLPAALEHFRKGVIAVGDNFVRRQVHRRILDLRPDFEGVCCVHPSAVLGQGVGIGQGTVVMPGAIINRDTTIGHHCIVNTGSQLDHDCELEDYSSLAPGAVCGGSVSIGGLTALSLGSKVLHGRKIGPHTVIGSGALVLRDMPSHVVAYGTPCKTVRMRAEGESYL